MTLTIDRPVTGPRLRQGYGGHQRAPHLPAALRQIVNTLDLAQHRQHRRRELRELFGHGAVRIFHVGIAALEQGENPGFRVPWDLPAREPHARRRLLDVHRERKFPIGVHHVAALGLDERTSEVVNENALNQVSIIMRDHVADPPMDGVAHLRPRCHRSSTVTAPQDGIYSHHHVTSGPYLGPRPRVWSARTLCPSSSGIVGNGHISVDDTVPPEEVEAALAALQRSQRTGDRLAWHLMTCARCVEMGGDDAPPQLLCSLGYVLWLDDRSVWKARRAFANVPRDQRRLLLEDLIQQMKEEEAL